MILRSVPRWKTGAVANRCAGSIFSPPGYLGSLEQVKFGGAADSFSQYVCCRCECAAANKENLKAQKVEREFSSQLNIFQLGLVLSM